ncbi:MAG: hypothetical protein H8E30_00435 [Alphaproteobacteria bacterium]|nr:hypothetical protein [Alphaproteobacteria bacterium]
MRFHVKFDHSLSSYTVHDRGAADQTIGVHRNVKSAYAHADAEESLWQRYGEARHAANVHERKKHIPWAA